ncbi:MAG TPA: NAD-dependent epimerase/dehydratase family protein [Thermoleophilaceae bacterium]
MRRLATRVLVTGGLGFIGSRLVPRLLGEGYAVRCVDDLSAAVAPGTGAAAAGRLAARGVEVVSGRARPAHVAGMDAVVHLAALPGVRSQRSPSELRAVNVELAGRLARAAARSGARFVFTSSSSVYGNASVLPTPEDARFAPLNAYARSKVAAEAAVLAAGGDPVIVRPFSVYGPGQRRDMAFARWIRALEAGEPLPWHAPAGTARDFTYVDDVADGIVAALRRGRAGRAYNLSGRRPVSLSEALAVLAGGREPVLREQPSSTAEAFVTHGCGRRAAVELGYAPRVELAEGLRRQLAGASPGRLAA